MVKKVENLK